MDFPLVHRVHHPRNVGAEGKIIDSKFTGDDGLVTLSNSPFALFSRYFSGFAILRFNSDRRMKF
jgi:hypothetical protein